MDHISPIIEIGGFRLDLAIVSMIVLSSIIVFILARLAVRNLSMDKPSAMQNFMEWTVEFVENIIGTSMKLEIGRRFLTLGMTLIMFIFVANLLGIPLQFVTELHEDTIFIQDETWNDVATKAESKGEEPHVHVAWFKSPTANAATTMGLALMVVFLTHYQGMRKNTRHYWKHYIEPYPAFLPLNLIKEVSKPLSLGLRLFGNIFAGEVMIGVILGLGIIGIPALVVWQGFSLFIGAIQSFVFVMLTMVYMSQTIVHEDH
ncbi:MAG: F0F1 ATP synthase subunit A [Paenibacillaceae bacterium]